MLTFPFPVKADLNDEMSLPSIILSYGDGNKQRSPDGLNLPKTVWNIQCPIDSKARSAALQSFLVSVGNHIPFLWQSPRDAKPEFYYIAGKIGGTYRLGGGKKPDFFVRSMQFEYANINIVEAISIGSLPIAPPAAVSIIGGTEATGFTISVATVQPTNTVIFVGRFYVGAYTGFLNDSVTVTVLANSLSANLPFGNRMTTASFGSITASINPSGQLYVLDVNGSNVATINFP